MKYNEVNVIVDNVFTQEEINDIYKSLQNNSGGDFVKVHCQANTFINLSKNIIDKVTDKAREVSQNYNIVLTEYCHARYNNVTSNCGRFHYRPSLFPHYDETFKEPRFTFDYQLAGNIEWPIIVEPDKSFSLKNNQAVTFSGTHQIHWRQPQAFTDNDFIEMIFFHFSDPSMGLKEPDVNEIMNAKAKLYSEKFYANGGFSNSDSD